MECSGLARIIICFGLADEFVYEALSCLLLLPSLIYLDRGGITAGFLFA